MGKRKYDAVFKSRTRSIGKSLRRTKKRRSTKRSHNRTQDSSSTALIIIVATILLLVYLSSADYAKPADSDRHFPLFSNFLLIFIIVDAIIIGIPFIIFSRFTNDNSKITNIGFFTVYGAISGVILGEVLPSANPALFILVIPYGIIMYIYAKLYAAYPFHLVAMSTYMAGIIIENIINRSPIHAATVLWIGILIHPYFVTKIYENKNRTNLKPVTEGLNKAFMWGLVFAFLAFIFSTQVGENQVSPPLIFIAFVIPFIVIVLRLKR